MVMSQKSKKRRFDIFDYFYMGLNLFLFVFFLLYINKFSITSFVVPALEGEKWKMILNIGIWYVVVMYCFDGFFKIFNKKDETKK